MTDEFKALRKFDADKGREGFLYSLPALEEHGIGKISRLPISIRIVLESVLRNCDGKKVRRKDVETLAIWWSIIRSKSISSVQRERCNSIWIWNSSAIASVTSF